MSSVTDLVDLLKQGAISKEELMTRMKSPDITISSSFVSDPKLQVEDLQWSLPLSPKVGSPSDGTMENEDLTPQLAPQMSAATFSKPQLSLRSSISSGHLPPEQFYVYQTNWKRSREEASEQLKERLQAAEVKDCTFHPKTNPASIATASPAFDRLYRVRDPRYFDRVKAEIDNKAEYEELKLCSFRPKINLRSRSTASRLMDTGKDQKINPRTLRDIEKDCTFVPKVNQVKRGMTAAKEYLSESPFERLARPKQVEVAAEKSIALSSIPSSKEPSKQIELPGEYVSYSQKPFYERQALFELMKAEKRQNANQPDLHQPSILDRSKKMVTEDFEHRNLRLLEQRKQHSDPKVYDTECTFAPSISKKGQEKRSRTIEEMAYGDLQRRELKLAYLKDAIDQQNLGLNVQQLSTCNVSTTSHLQLSENLNTYLTRVQRDREKKERAVDRIRMERQSREMAECTHAPITKDAPAYIKRIARSVAMLKAEMPPPEPPERPEWR